MRLSKLRRKLIKQAKRERRKNNMSRNDFLKVVAVANDKTALAEVNRRIETEVYATRLVGASLGGFLSNLWDWFVANWPKILNIILTVAPLLLMEPKDEDS